MNISSLTLLPAARELETNSVLRELVRAHRALAELKGVALTLPNEGLLISTLTLQEAQSSSEIENIITTQDKLYKYRIQAAIEDPVSKEVARYAQGLTVGFHQVRESGLLTLKTVKQVQAKLEGNDAGFRKLPGTVLENEQTGEVVFEPPSPELVPSLMADLEKFAHDCGDLDALVRMAILHHRFETIHPFYDGNGRTGRILNILYLVKEGLLDTPILYMSRYISQTKSEYYRLLQETRGTQEWEPWLLYMLRGVAVTAQHATQLVTSIRDLVQATKLEVREKHKFYSHELINNIFGHPYTKVAFLKEDLGVSRATATRYLDALAESGVLIKNRLGRESYYVNHALVHLLFNLPELKL
ncbi:MAG: addiction module protein [Planctomycetota bacterium]|nr:MAG: addiction module protein [Planctomycetota bacterium]